MTNKNVLAVHDISCVGRCSLTVALPIMSAYGVETRLLPTALLSTHTGGFTGFTYLDLTDEMKNILKAWEPLELDFNAIYSGFMASAEQIDLLREIASIYKKANNLVVIDPVMADNGELYSVFDQAFVEKMKEVIDFADVLMPNITEACFLTDTPYPEGLQTEEFVQELIGKLRRQGAKQIVLTGVQYEAGKIGVATSEGEGDLQTYFAKEIPGHYHGTGDIFGSVLTAELVNGKSLEASAESAVDFVLASIEATPEEADKKYGVDFEQVLAARGK
ncbi:pyridoxamine kinase [Lactococcus termiticola]|uniref:pyridoxal kinase n=1 Tax=Lactococcus termiticola TaxID=2169526 RepID=A0A2R5HIM9_9LACT|nr:pyridoxamine kinase [Lactococcus termiticola]GBG95911.1 pyridoxal kinase [Lactococcus termiticola]